MDPKDERVARVRCAIDQAGGVLRVAAAFGISRISVYGWIENGYVPAKRAVVIEQLSGGRARCEDTCPDVDWSVVRGSACRGCGGLVAQRELFEAAPQRDVRREEAINAP